jgi:hypothetical protein
MKAEDRALEAYPKDIKEFVGVNGMKSVVDYNSWQRTIFLNGYHQAEKDLELTVDDIKSIDRLLNQCVDCSNPHQEVLKRFIELWK